MEGCHPQPTALFSVVRRWILYVPPGPDFLDDETTLRGPFGGPNLSAGVLVGSACCGSGGFSNVSWMSPSRFSSRTKGRFSLGGVTTTPSTSSSEPKPVPGVPSFSMGRPPEELASHPSPDDSSLPELVCHGYKSLPSHWPLLATL